METHMTTLGATLLAINKRQSAQRRRTRRGVNATPFTTAVLNRERLDIVTYIRDADHHTEANLFWYPPPPQSQQHAGPSQYGAASASHHHQQRANGKHRGAVGGAKGLDAQEAEGLLAPRMPEPRHVQPPTPLRNTLAARNRGGDAAAVGADDRAVDIKTLLLAAQKLNDDYRSAPKARKHIKGLLKKHQDLAKTVRECEQRSQANEARIRSIRDGKSDGLLALPSSSAHEDGSSSSAHQAELSRIRQATQKEELEILALEELISELKQEAKVKQQAKAARKAAAPAAEAGRNDQRARSATPRADLTDVRAPKAPTPQPAPALDGSIAAPPSTHPEIEQPSSKEPTEAAFVEQGDSRPEDDTEGPADGDETATIRLPGAASQVPTDGEEHAVTEAEAAAEEPDPESTPELERATANVWRLFGDGLRHVAPDKETGDYHETLRILRLIVAGGLQRHQTSVSGAGIGDTSLGSTHTSTTQTTESSTATTGSSSLSSTPFSADLMMSAYVILRMLTTPGPTHSLIFEDLKQDGHRWWVEQGGMEAYERACRTDDIDDRPRGEVPADGNNLARKNIYGMVSKQLFTLKRNKGVGIVEFV